MAFEILLFVGGVAVAGLIVWGVSASEKPRPGAGLAERDKDADPKNEA